MNNIFLGLSQQQVNIFQSFFLKKVVGGKDKNILITDAAYNVDAPKWNEIYYTQARINNQAGSFIARVIGIISKIKSYKKTVKQIKKYKHEGEVTLYCSTIEDVLSNYLFFYFNKHINAVIIEDGILNYYWHTHKNLSPVVLILKKLIALCYGINFKSFYKGHTSGISYDKALYQYVREPDYSISPKKSKLLQTPSRNISALTNSILIIGQEPYANLRGKTFFNRKLEQLISFVKISPYYESSKTIFYKPHRHGPRISEAFFENSFFGKEVCFLKAEDVLEDLYFSTLKSKTVFSFDSSAVLNIYLECPLEVRSGMDVNLLPIAGKDLVDLFKKFNFKLLDNDF